MRADSERFLKDVLDSVFKFLLNLLSQDWKIWKRDYPLVLMTMIVVTGTRIGPWATRIPGRRTLLMLVIKTRIFQISTRLKKGRKFLLAIASLKTEDNNTPFRMGSIALLTKLRWSMELLLHKAESVTLEQHSEEVIYESSSTEESDCDD